MLEDSLIFQLFILAPLKGKKNENLDAPKKERSAKCQSMTLLALIFKLSVYVKQNCGSFYVCLLQFNFYFNFPFLSFTFQKQNLVTNSKHI